LPGPPWRFQRPGPDLNGAIRKCSLESWFGHIHPDLTPCQ
jgi:hypothetical protein